MAVYWRETTLLFFDIRDNPAMGVYYG